MNLLIFLSLIALAFCALHAFAGGEYTDHDLED